MWLKSFPGGGDSKCKGSEAGTRGQVCSGRSVRESVRGRAEQIAGPQDG